MAHPNITGAQAYHSHGNLILRPSAFKRDAELPPEDVALFKRLGEVGSQLTGYPVISTFEDFTPNLRSPRHGVFTDWLYDHLGIPAFSNELWDVERAAGLEKSQHFSTRPLGESEHVALLRWAEAHSPTAFSDWTPFVHPQLGPVEIGGWDPFLIHRNPPPRFIREVAHPNCLFTIRHALASPQLSIRSVEARHLDAGFYQVRAVVENLGFLPTHLTSRAQAIGLTRPIQVSLECEAGAELLMGERTVQIESLAGREERQMPYDAWRRPWGEPARLVEWLVRAPRPASPARERKLAHRGLVGG